MLFVVSMPPGVLALIHKNPMNSMEYVAKSGILGHRSGVTVLVPIDASSSHHSPTSTNGQACGGLEHDLNDRIDELDLFTNHVNEFFCLSSGVTGLAGFGSMSHSQSHCAWFHSGAKVIPKLLDDELWPLPPVQGCPDFQRAVSRSCRLESLSVPHR